MLNTVFECSCRTGGPRLHVAEAPCPAAKLRR